MLVNVENYLPGQVILGEDDDPTKISVHITGAVHEEDNGRP